jgi:hypothetical protein
MRWARQSISEAERENFLEMAKVWTELATQESLSARRARIQQSNNPSNPLSEKDPAPK